MQAETERVFNAYQKFNEAQMMNQIRVADMQRETEAGVRRIWMGVALVGLIVAGSLIALSSCAHAACLGNPGFEVCSGGGNGYAMDSDGQAVQIAEPQPLGFVSGTTDDGRSYDLLSQGANGLTNYTGTDADGDPVSHTCTALGCD